MVLRGRFYGEFFIFENGYKFAELKVNQITDVTPEVIAEKVDFENFSLNEFKVSIQSQAYWNSSISVYDGDLSPPLDLSYQSIDFLSFNSGKFKYTYAFDDEDLFYDDDITDSVFTLMGHLEMKGDKWDKFLDVKKKREIKLKGKNEKMRLVSFGYRLLTEPNYLYQEINFDTLGNLEFPQLTFYDTLEARFVQIDERLKLMDYSVDLKFSRLPKLNKLILSEYLLGQDISQKYSGRYNPDYYQYEFGNSELKEVRITKQMDARKLMLKKKYSKGWFLNHDSFLEIDLLNYDLPGWIFTRKELLDYLFHKYPKLRSLEAEYLVNNLHNYQGGQLPIDVSEIKYIRFYEKYIHNRTGGGAIMFYTTGIDARNKDIGTAKIRIQKIAGYSGFLDFRMPDYIAHNKPRYDDRLTLFWTADQSLKGGKEARFKFFNNSLSESYYIHLNLISEGGAFLSYQKKIE